MMIHHMLMTIETALPAIRAEAGLLAQAQPEVMGGVPLWILVVGALAVIIFAVTWVLYEEGQAGEKAEVRQPAMSATSVRPDVSPTGATVETAEPGPVPETTAAPPPAQVDDLTRIEGIGPKIAGLLQAVNITTFAQLAATEVSRLRQILREAGLTALTDPTTWPEQARLAAAGDWEALEKLQDELKGGRRA